MYDDHYGLTGKPFQLTPDPRFWVETATHRKAMAYLGYGLSQGEGFIVITGDIGTGKTTLVGHLMATIDRERLHVIKIVSTQIEAEDLLRLVAHGMGVTSEGLAKAQLLERIERQLHATARAGRRTLLVIDEAQALPTGSLEELRMLSNFQAGGHALLQIFLLGQPEFRERLQGSERLEQLRQRVIATHHLDPMARAEVELYVHHRLSVVGWSGRPHFTDDAFAALHQGSDGVPRRLNQLAARVLLAGAIDNCETIDGALVQAVIADMTGDMMPVRAAAVPERAELEMAVPDAPAERPQPEVPRPLMRAVEPIREPRPLPVVQSVPETARPDPAPRPEAMTRPEPGVAERLEKIEARLDEQDAALRRVLTLLVDWVEGDGQRPDAASLSGTAA